MWIQVDEDEDEVEGVSRVEATSSVEGQVGGRWS